MKYLIFISFFNLLLTQCSEDEVLEKPDPLHGSWNVVNISGGFAGINDDYERGSIIWDFDSVSSTLSVSNTHEKKDVLYDGFPTGAYNYMIITSENSSYLQINEGEFAGIELRDNQLILNQNQSTSGTGADGFVLVFQK